MADGLEFGGEEVTLSFHYWGIAEPLPQAPSDFNLQPESITWLTAWDLAAKK